MKQETLHLNVAANIAIFHMQLPMVRAINFVSGRARVDRRRAHSAIEKALIGYKNKAKA
jgi:hypothetical protein